MGDRVCSPTLLPPQPLLPDPLRYEQGASCSRHHGREPVDGPVTQTVSLKKPFLPWSRSPERCPKQSLGHVVACFGGEPERFWGDILSLFMLWLPLLILLSHWGRHDWISHHLDKAESIRTLQDAPAEARPPVPIE